MNYNIFVDLLKDAHRYEYLGISDTTEETSLKKPRFLLTKTQWILLVVSLTVPLWLSSGYNPDFCGYAISALALFVGIIFSFVISLYDKFSTIDFKQYHYTVNADKYPLGIRLKNYYKKTTVLSLYLIVLSILCIILLSGTLLFPNLLGKGLSLCSFVNKDINFSILVLGIMFYRCGIFYLLSRFVVFTIYLTSSIYDFIIGEYDKIKLK